MSIIFIDQLRDLNGKQVFLRTDFNIPMNETGNITDDTRITGVLPTIRYLIDHGAKIALASHLGRPEGKREMKFSMAPVTRRMSELLDREVKQAPDCFGTDIRAMIGALNTGEELAAYMEKIILTHSVTRLC